MGGMGESCAGSWKKCVDIAFTAISKFIYFMHGVYDASLEEIGMAFCLAAGIGSLMLIRIPTNLLQLSYASSGRRDITHYRATRYDFSRQSLLKSQCCSDQQT